MKHLLLGIGGLGTWELILILVVVLIVFGVGRLPEIGTGLGKGIRNFKKSINGDSSKEDSHDDDSKKL